MNELYSEIVDPHHAAVSLLALHGPMGLDVSYFRPELDALSELFRLVYLDQRGHGRSPASVGPVVLDQFADDAMEALRHHGTDKAVLLGHSAGVSVALHAAVRSPNNVAGLILVSPFISPSVGGVMNERIQQRGTEKQRAMLAAAFSGQITSDAEYRAAWDALFPLYFARSRRDLQSRILANVQFRISGFDNYMKHCFGTLDWKKAAAAIRVPTLVIAGADDWLDFEEGGSKALASAVPNGTLHSISNAGHFPFLEEPDAFVTVVRSWVEAASGAGEASQG